MTDTVGRGAAAGRARGPVTPALAPLLLALLVAATAPLGAQGTPPTRPDSTNRPAVTAGDTAGARAAAAPAPLIPALDQARGTDAEVRVALYELTRGQYIPALSRLEWLRNAPTTLSPAGAPGALRGREDVSFLLAQTYLRFGMDSAFRAAAEPLVWTSIGGKYSSILRSQLLLEAYRRGDYPGAKKIAAAIGTTPEPDDAGLGALVTGLTAYQTGDYAAARAAFARVQQPTSPYTPYARYMDVLAELRADTSKAAATIQSLTSLATSTGVSAEFADQVRLTAAQLAYETKQYPQAASLAEAIAPTSGLGAEALMTRAWALYKSDQTGPAGDAFADFARRYPQLPESNEARLMSAQVLLQLGRSDEAGRAFQSVADSVAAQTRGLQAGAAGVMSNAARALVGARAAGLLFVTAPASGKTVALQDRTGTSDSLLTAVVADTGAILSGGGAAVAAAPELVSLADISARLDTVSGALGADFPKRAIFTPASSPANFADYASRSQALYAADAQVALARYRLQQQMESQARQIALLRALQQQLADGNAIISPLATQLNAAQDSLARLSSLIDAAGQRIRQMLQQNSNETRTLADENTRMIDSVRTSLGGSIASNDAAVLQLEAQTSATYRRLADAIDAGMNGALSRHPVFAMRDSLRLKAQRLAGLLGETQRALASAQSLVGQEVARLEAGGEGEPVRAARATLATAEARRAAVEGQLIAVVERELNARAGLMLASLRRDGEAADFGAASASFFQAIDAGRTAGTSDSSGTSNATGGSASTTTGGGTAAPAAPAAASPAPTAPTSPRK
ncbi:MAG TPA: hypothetical protein VNS52_03835 [Gemmatimonadaceae bacterium]|nr:hypothetical protein [Gemmatimonadaceae bacterium]